MKALSKLLNVMVGIFTVTRIIKLLSLALTNVLGLGRVLCKPYSFSINENNGAEAAISGHSTMLANSASNWENG